MNTKFTIIIPTRERPDTLFYTIKTAITQNYDNFSIIVSDNYSQDNTKQIVESFNDSRIKYVNPGRRLSMANHWEFALSHVTDGWVTLLGDDDGLMPDALSKVNDVINKTHVQAVTTIRNTYGWSKSKIEANHLIVFLTEGYEFRNGHEWITKFIRDDTATTSDLPCFSTGGFADIEAINRARDKNGKFFLSITPDVYSAFALGSILDKYVFLKEPVFISGASHHSIGISGIGNSGLANVKKFFSENDIPFHDYLIGMEYIGSIPLGNYDCYLKTSFLHNEYLKIKLEDKLAFALSRLSIGYNEELINFCKNVSERNNIDFNIIVKKSENLKKQIRIPKIKKIYDYLFNRRTIYDCTEFGVQDVYSASLLARFIYLQETKYSHWRLFIILKVIKMILNYKSTSKIIKNVFSTIRIST